MKKFLAKLWVMITLLVVTAGVAGLTVGLLVRPVAFGWNYGVTAFGLTSDALPGTMKLNHNTATLTIKDAGDDSGTYKFFVLRNGSHCAIYTDYYEKDGQAVAGKSYDSAKAAAEALYNQLTAAEKELFWQANLSQYDPSAPLTPGSVNYTYPQHYTLFSIVAPKTNAYYLQTFGQQMFQGYSKVAVPYTICLSVLFAVVATFATLSVIFYVKSKKQPAAN